MTNLLHLNGNVLCAVDVGTTGDTPGFHDVIQVCVLPLDAELKPASDVVPFYCDLKPRRPQNCTPEHTNVSRERICRATLDGLDPDRAADLFDEWVDRFKLAFNKRISPLAHNWPFDREFMIDWLGRVNFNHRFDARFRDLMSTALYEQDRDDARQEMIRFAKVNLRYIGSTLKIENYKAHDCLADCITTAQCYKMILQQSLWDKVHHQ